MAQNCKTCDYDASTYEVMEFSVQGDKVMDWIAADTEVWTNFLSKQPGYTSKGDYYPQDCDLTKTVHCLITTVTKWEKLSDWKNVPQDETYFKNFEQFSQEMSEKKC